MPRLRFALALLLGLCALVGTGRHLAEAQFPAPIGNIHSVSVRPRSQTITSIAPSSCTIATGATGTCTALTVTMSPASPTFTASPTGALLVVSQTLSGGKCTHTSDTSDFGIGPGTLNLNLVNPSATAGTDYVCIQASKSGAQTKYQEVAATVTGGGGGIACSIGPNYQGSIPAAAQAAGFTACAANYDFTQTASFTNNGTSHQWSNMGSWLDCAGASGSQILWTLAWNSCGRVTIETDYAGKQALHLQLQPGDFSTANNTVIQTSGPSNNFSPSSMVATFPVGKYVEFVEYETAGSPHACDTGSGCGSGIITANWSWPANNDGIEWDWLEMYTNNSGGSGGDGAQSHYYGSITNVGHSGQVNVWQVSGYDPFHYQTYGVRVATDGTPNGDFAECIYYNGAIVSSVPYGSQECATGTWTPGTTTPNRNAMILTAGPQSGTGSYANIDFYVERETIWECPNSGGSGTYGAGGAGSECNNAQSAVTGSGALTNAP